MRQFPIAVIQMASGQDPEENLQALSAFVREAARRGARAAALPESVSYRGVEMERYAEEVPGGPTFQCLSALARAVAPRGQHLRKKSPGGTALQLHHGDPARRHPGGQIPQAPPL